MLYAPGAQTKEAIKAIVEAVAPKPVNVQMSVSAGLAVTDLAAMGACRISVGSALARAAWTGFIRAASLIARDGAFTGFEGSILFAEIDRFFSRS